MPTSTTTVASATRRYADLPGPRGVPLLGNALQVDPPRFHRQLEAWAREYGDFFKLQIKERHLLVVGQHEAVAAVLRDRPGTFRRSRKNAEMWVEMGLPIGLLGAEGEVWARQRRMVMAAFDPAHIRSYFPSMLRVAGRLVRRWEMAAREGRAIELQAELMRFTVDTIAGLAFGEEVNTLESDEDVIQRHLNLIFPAVFNRTLSALPLWRVHKSRADRRLDEAVAAVNAAVAGFIVRTRERMAREPVRREQPQNLLEAMIAAADRPDSGIGDEQVAGNVLVMLLGGEDTTANTLAWMIHLLWQHPAALARACEEVRAALGGAGLDEITPEQLGSLDFLEACMHETMRLKPVAPLVPVQALHETTIADVQVPADTVILALMRRDSVSEAHFEQADRFRPERWLGTASHGSDKRIAMPFGAGPRICPGRYLAMLEIKLAMVALLGRFDIAAVDTPDGEEPRELMAFTMAPVGLTMRLRPRAA